MRARVRTSLATDWRQRCTVAVTQQGRLGDNVPRPPAGRLPGAVPRDPAPLCRSGLSALSYSVTHMGATALWLSLILTVGLMFLKRLRHM